MGLQVFGVENEAFVVLSLIDAPELLA